MNGPLSYADEEIKWFRERFGDILTEEDYRILRLELITAYRKGFELASTKSTKQNKIKFNGKETNVKIQIKNNEIILTFPNDTETSNWYHAITIKKEE